MNLPKTYFAMMHFIGRSHALGKVRLMHALCKCQSARSFCFHQHGFEKHISLYTCHREININIHKSGMLQYRHATCGEKQRAGKKLFLRKCTDKDNFKCLITIWSFGIARRGLKELSFVKTSNSNQDIFHFCL